MTSATLALRTATPLGAAWLRAVAVTVVAPRAEEKHLATLEDRANNEAERVHVPARGTVRKLELLDPIVRVTPARPTSRSPKARCANTGPSSFPTSRRVFSPDRGYTSKFTRVETTADIVATRVAGGPRQVRGFDARAARAVGRREESSFPRDGRLFPREGLA